MAKETEKSHAIANFKIAAGLEKGEFCGMIFQDSDVAKWIEGAAYSLTIRIDINNRAEWVHCPVCGNVRL